MAVKTRHLTGCVDVASPTLWRKLFKATYWSPSRNGPTGQDDEWKANVDDNSMADDLISMGFDPASKFVQTHHITTEFASDHTLTGGQVAAMFNVNPKTVARWATAGLLTHIRTPGGHRRYREDDVIALLNRPID